MNFVQFAFVVTVSLLCHVKCENNNLAKFEERAIINGYNAPYRPFYVKIQLYHNGEDVPGLCGGTIVGPKDVLTGAHCFRGDEPENMNMDYNWDQINVYVGDMSHPNYADTVTKLSAINVTVHPGYTGNVLQGYDVTVLKLNQTVGNDRILRMCKSDENFDTDPIAVCGFGETYGGDDTSNPPQLREAQIHEGGTDFSCGEDNMFNKDLQICMESIPGRTYSLTCEGDSGGPAFPLGMVAPICLYGTVSFGTTSHSMCDAEVVFSRVSAYKDWIEDVIYP